MKAVIIVGGFGTRLRPLTLNRPKPLVEFANKPMILHQIKALKAAGVTEVTLAISYQPQEMLSFIKEFEPKLGFKINCSQENEPLGTAGPLALAKDKLFREAGEPFFVLNSDIVFEYPLKELLEFHKAHGGEASILVTQVHTAAAECLLEMTRLHEKTNSAQRKEVEFLDELTQLCEIEKSEQAKTLLKKCIAIIEDLKPESTAMTLD